MLLKQEVKRLIHRIRYSMSVNGASEAEDKAECNDDERAN